MSPLNKVRQTGRYYRLRAHPSEAFPDTELDARRRRQGPASPAELADYWGWRGSNSNMQSECWRWATHYNAQSVANERYLGFMTQVLEK